QISHIKNKQNIHVIESTDETLLLGNDWFQRAQVRIHFDEQRLFLKHDGKRIEVPISSNGTKKLEVPEERDQPGRRASEAEGYYTEEAVEEPMDLFYNSWEESTSPALYLTNVEEMPTKDDDETKITVERWIEQFLQNDNLDKEDKEKAASFFKQERTLFASDIRELGETNHRSGCTHWNADALSRINGTEDDIVEIYMAIVESGEEELVTEKDEKQNDKEQTNLPNFEQHLALEILDRQKAIYTIEFHGFNLIATEPKQLLVLRDWVITGAKQELIRREYLLDTSIDLGYTKPLDLQEIEKDKNAN
ncbi:12204_t:CDS:2, partial [Cetraspora pellucida]